MVRVKLRKILVFYVVQSSDKMALKTQRKLLEIVK